eukprot:g1348.t1
MPLFLLCLKANLDNIARIELAPDYHFDVTVKNPESEDTRDVVISTEELIPLSTGRATAHFVMKWDKSSKNEATLSVLDVKGVTRVITSDDSDEFVPLIGFECRGLEPVEFRPGVGFIVEGTGGQTWEEVDLSESDWCEFEEATGQSVGIYEIESKFQLRKR